MMLNRRFLSKLVISGLLAIGLGGCANSGQTKPISAPLRVEFSHWWGDSTILVAEKLGLFDKYGVQVEPVLYKDKTLSLSDLASGRLDGGLFTLGDTLTTNDRTPLLLVAIYDDGGLNYIVGAPEVKTPADLKNARIGVNVGSLGEIFIKNTLDLGGLSLRDVNIVDMAPEEVPANLGSTIDAGYVWGPYASDVLGQGANLLYKTQVAGTFTMDVIVFRMDVARNRPEDIKAFLKAWFEAVDFRISNPGLSNTLIMNAMSTTKEQLSEGAKLFTATDNAALFTTQGSGSELGLMASLNANIGFLSRQGTLRQIPNLNELVDPSYLP